MPILDFAKLNGDQIESLDRIFDGYYAELLEPMKYLYRDKVRIAIDEQMLEVSGIDVSLDNLRKRLCMEPSISGGRVNTDLRDCH